MRRNEFPASFFIIFAVYRALIPPSLCLTESVEPVAGMHVREHKAAHIQYNASCALTRKHKIVLSAVHASALSSVNVKHEKIRARHTQRAK